MNVFGSATSRLFGRFRRPHPSQSPSPTDARETKKSAVGSLLGSATSTAWLTLKEPQWTARTYEQLAREGFRKNAVCHRAVKIVAESAAAVPLTLSRGDQRIDRHPILDLLARPNPLQSGKELIEAFHAYLQIAGNAYLEAAETLDKRPGELYVLRPDRMKVIPGACGWPERFEYRVGAKVHHFQLDRKTGDGPVMHLRLFNPTDDWYGLSPLEAAAYAVDLHNAASHWNKALLDNAARPSGALVFEPGDGASSTLSDEQFKRLKTELEDQYQGAINAGRPFLLEGGLKWQQIAFSPHDMEFINSKHVSAREIALAFGVPPMILGIPGDNSFANYAEANRALWRLTLLPLLEKWVSALNAWLVPKYNDPDLRLDFDRDAIPALTYERDALWARIGAATFLTPNEKRNILGFENIEGERLGRATVS